MAGAAGAGTVPQRLRRAILRQNLRQDRPKGLGTIRAADHDSEHVLIFRRQVIPGIDVREHPQEFESGQGVGHARWRSPARNYTQTTHLALDHLT